MLFWSKQSLPRAEGTSALQPEATVAPAWSPWGHTASSPAMPAPPPSRLSRPEGTGLGLGARAKLNVMIIDDEHLVLKIAGSMLRQLGAEWLGVISGREGVEMLRNEETPCNLLLLDVMLGDTTGFDVYRKVRSFRRRLPIVFISGFCSQEVLADTLQADPLTSFLPKPFSLADIRLTLAAFSA